MGPLLPLQTGGLATHRSRSGNIWTYSRFLQINEYMWLQPAITSTNNHTGIKVLDGGKAVRSLVDAGCGGIMDPNISPSHIPTSKKAFILWRKPHCLVSSSE